MGVAERVANWVGLIIAGLIDAFFAGGLLKQALLLIGVRQSAPVIGHIEIIALHALILGIILGVAVILACGFHSVWEFARKRLSTKSDRRLFADSLRREWLRDL